MTSPPDRTGSTALSAWWDVLSATLSTWMTQRAASKGASLAFYSLLSLPPTLVLATWVSRQLFPYAGAEAGIARQVRSLLGADAATAVTGLLAVADAGRWSAATGLVALITLLIGASAAFAELKATLDELWADRTPVGGPGLAVRARVLSVGLTVMLAFLVAVSLVLSALLSGLAAHPRLPWHASAAWTHAASTVGTFLALWILFAIIYKVLPAAHMAWRDVLLGALLTAALFASGRWAIGLYLGDGAVASRYGAAGPVITLLLWVYYAGQLFLLGAIFTRHYAMRARRRVY